MLAVQIISGHDDTPVRSKIYAVQTYMFKKEHCICIDINVLSIIHIWATVSYTSCVIMAYHAVLLYYIIC